MSQLTEKQDCECPICGCSGAKMWHKLSQDSFGFDDTYIECKGCKKTYVKSKDLVLGLFESISKLFDAYAHELWREIK